MLKQASCGQRPKGDMPSAQGHRVSQQPGMHHQGHKMHVNLSSQMARPPQLLSYSTPRAPRLLERMPASAEKTQCITRKSTPSATVQDAMSIQQQMIARGQPDDSAPMSARLLTTTLEYAVYDGASPPSPSPGQPDTEQVPPLPAPSPEPPLPSRPIAMGCATTQGRTIDDDSLLALAVAEPRLTRSPPPPLQLTGSTSPTRSTPPTPLPRVSDMLNFGTYEEHDHPRPFPSSVKNWTAVSNTGEKQKSNKPRSPTAQNWLVSPEISSRDTLMGTAAALLQSSRTQPTNTEEAYINGPTPNDPISQTDLIVLFDQALDENRLRKAKLDKITRERDHILGQSKDEGNSDGQVHAVVCEGGVEILSNDMHQQPVRQHQAEFEARPSSKRAQQSEGPGLQRKGPMDSKVEMQQQQQKTPSRIPSVSAMSAMTAAAHQQQKKTPARLPSASAVSAMAAAAHEQRKKNETANNTTVLEITKPKQENQGSEAQSYEVSDFSHGTYAKYLANDLEITSKEICKTVHKERQITVKEEADIITAVKASGAQIPSTAPISIADAASVAETVEGESGCKEGALGGNGGVGIAIMIQNGKVVVTGVKKGGSAHNAGIILADCIVSIDGQPLDSKNEAEVKALISGDPGSVVRVHAIRKSAFFGMLTHIKVDLVRELPCSQNADIKVKSDIKIYSHVVEGGYADSDQATMAPWPGHVTSQEEDGGLSKSQTSVLKFAKSTPALAQTPSKTQAQAHAQMRNETKTPARKQAAATAQVQTQQRKEGSSIHLSANQGVTSSGVLLRIDESICFTTDSIKFGGCGMDPIGQIFDANTASEDWNPVNSLQSDALAYAQHQEVELEKALSFQRTSSLEKDMIGSNPRENGDGWEQEQSLKVQTDASAVEESTKNLDNGDREIDNANAMAAHYVDVISEHVARLQQQSQPTNKINENQHQPQNLDSGDKELMNAQAMAEHYADSIIEHAARLQQQSQRTKKIMENQLQHPSIPPRSCSSPSPPSQRTIQRSSSQRYGFNQSEGKYPNHFAGAPVLNTLTTRINTTFKQSKGNDNQQQHSKTLQVNQNYQQHVVGVPAYKGAYKDPYLGTK